MSDTLQLKFSRSVKNILHSNVTRDYSTQPMIKDPITTTQAASILECDPSTIRHAIRRGTLEFEKRGRDNYVSKRAILARKRKRQQRLNGKETNAKT